MGKEELTLTNDVFLRPIEYSDLEYLFKWRNDKEIFMQLGGGYFPTSKTEMEKWMDNFCKKDLNNPKFIIEFEKKPVGFISINNINYINRSGDLGIYIGELDFQGKGIATKALTSLELFAKKQLNLRKIKLLMNGNNIGALKLYEKLSYDFVGKYMNERFVDGDWIDVIIMEKFL